MIKFQKSSRLTPLDWFLRLSPQPSRFASPSFQQLHMTCISLRVEPVQLCQRHRNGLSVQQLPARAGGPEGLEGQRSWGARGAGGPEELGGQRGWGARGAGRLGAWSRGCVCVCVWVWGRVTLLVCRVWKTLDYQSFL